MQRYQSHKQVHADPMTRGEYNKYRGWVIPPDEDPRDLGYLVIYNRGTEDHYESWSPKHVFDDGYTPISKGEGFCKILYTEEYGQILVTRGLDMETLEPCITATLEYSNGDFGVLTLGFSEGAEGNAERTKGFMAEINQEHATELGALILEEEAKAEAADE